MKFLIKNLWMGLLLFVSSYEWAGEISGPSFTINYETNHTGFTWHSGEISSYETEIASVPELPSFDIFKKIERHNDIKKLG